MEPKVRLKKLWSYLLYIYICLTTPFPPDQGLVINHRDQHHTPVTKINMPQNLTSDSHSDLPLIGINVPDV